MDYFEVESHRHLQKCFTRHLFRKGESGKKELIEEVPYQDYWFLEDPVSKGLVQDVQYELKPNESATFIVVLRSPVQRYSALFATNVVVTDE